MNFLPPIGDSTDHADLPQLLQAPHHDNSPSSSQPSFSFAVTDSQSSQTSSYPSLDEIFDTVKAFCEWETAITLTSFFNDDFRFRDARISNFKATAVPLVADYNDPDIAVAPMVEWREDDKVDILSFILVPADNFVPCSFLMHSRDVESGNSRLKWRVRQLEYLKPLLRMAQMVDGLLHSWPRQELIDFFIETPETNFHEHEYVHLQFDD